MVVKDEWQRQGCGTAMILRAEEDAVQLWSASRIYTKVDAENEVGASRNLGQEGLICLPVSTVGSGQNYQLCGYIKTGVA